MGVTEQGFVVLQQSVSPRFTVSSQHCAACLDLQPLVPSVTACSVPPPGDIFVLCRECSLVRAELGVSCWLVQQGAAPGVWQVSAQTAGRSFLLCGTAE